jgi:hypothetical protein
VLFPSLSRFDEAGKTVFGQEGIGGKDGAPFHHLGPLEQEQVRVIIHQDSNLYPIDFPQVHLVHFPLLSVSLEMAVRL